MAGVGYTQKFKYFIFVLILSVKKIKGAAHKTVTSTLRVNEALAYTPLLLLFQAYLDHSPQEVFDVLVPGVCDWPKWNPTILGCEVSLTKYQVMNVSPGGSLARTRGLASKVFTFPLPESEKT